jgi:hypothetical protein
MSSLALHPGLRHTKLQCDDAFIVHRSTTPPHREILGRNYEIPDTDCSQISIAADIADQRHQLRIWQTVIRQLELQFISFADCFGRPSWQN